jgi:hypothetical protein
MLSKAMEDNALSTFTMTIVARDKRDGETAIVEESWDVILCNESCLVEDLDDAPLRPLVVVSKDSLETTLVNKVCLLSDASNEKDWTKLIQFAASRGAMAIVVESVPPPDQASAAATTVPVFYSCKPCATLALLGELSVQFARKVDEMMDIVDDTSGASEATALRQNSCQQDVEMETMDMEGTGGGDEMPDGGKDGNPSSGEPGMKNTPADVASELTAELRQDTCSKHDVEMETMNSSGSGDRDELPDEGKDGKPSSDDHDVKFRSSGAQGMENADDSKPELPVTVDVGNKAPEDRTHRRLSGAAGLCSSTSNEENCGDDGKRLDAELEPPHIPPVRREPLVNLSDEGLSAQSHSAGRDKSTLSPMGKASVDPLLQVDDAAKSNTAHATSDDASDAELVSFHSLCDDLINIASHFPP